MNYNSATKKKRNENNCLILQMQSNLGSSYIRTTFYITQPRKKIKKWHDILNALNYNLIYDNNK